jgi:hypothetical protein
MHRGGIPVSSLATTFQDAIDITLKLGLEFIWIDSLCIVQNDPEERSEEFPKMGDIYGGAYFVIAATHATNGSMGCYKDRPRFHRVEFETPNGMPVKATCREKIKHEVWKTGEQFWEALELPLLGRAWALQERLLATRVVHFTPSELVWECRSGVDCECGDLQNPRTSWPEFGVGKTFKSRFNEVVKWGSDLERIKFWHDICAQYSARDISFPTDRLPALSSIAKQIDMPGILGQYLAGIWSFTLPGALLWWSEYTNPVLHLESHKKSHCRKRPCSIPTWSWLSIEGRVSTWGRNPQTTVRILDIPYALARKDPYGPCKDASIVIDGMLVPVEIIAEPAGDEPTAHSIRRPSTQEPFRLLSDTNPLEFSNEELSQSKIMALQFSSSVADRCSCIILKLVSGTPSTYERVGIAECPRIWFLGKVLQTVKLV